MTSRGLATRATRSNATRNTIKDENSNLQTGFLAKEHASAAAPGKPSVGVPKVSSSSVVNAAGGVKKALATAGNGKEGTARVTGAKRPALASVNNNGVRDPHVDTEVPSKATKLAGHARSRSTSVPTTGADDTSAAAAVAKPRVRSSKPSATLAASKSSSAVLEGATRPTARLPRQQGHKTSSLHDQRLSVHEEEMRDLEDEQEEEEAEEGAAGDEMAMPSEDMPMVDRDLNIATKRKDSGLTRTINGMDVAKDYDSEHFGACGVAAQYGATHSQGDEFVDEDDEEMEEDEDNWLALTREQAIEVEETLAHVRANFEDEIDFFDTTMVAEYSDDIFHYMEQLEETALPNPNYMDHQSEIEWSMRATLIDWLLQVHLRYHMLPETLWIAVNIVDRFLSSRVVSLVKLQLVGVTAMFVAAKYEEILAPSVEEFVYMTENGYTKEEILKGERIILQTLNFEVSSYCSPYSWVRKISKADDYDIQTRTLSKFLMEVTLLDHQFLRAKPSYVAAIGMYLARRMLDGDWNEAFIYFSNFTEIQLLPGAQLLIDNLNGEDFDKQYVYKKYANKKFLRASTFAKDWAKTRNILAPLSS